MTCPFCAIETSPTVFYSTPTTLAFLDIQPLVSSRVHALVIPRAHCASLHQLDPSTARDLGSTLVKVAGALCRATGSSAYNIVNNTGSSAGQVVNHVHFHVVVRDPTTPLSQQTQQAVTRERGLAQMQVYARGEREELGDQSVVGELRALLGGSKL